MRVALTIAGSDSGGGAGIQADLKTFAALGVHGTCALTALTAQNTQRVAAILPIPGEFVFAQIQAVVEDFEVGGTKTGMLPNAEVIHFVAEAVKRFRLQPLVVDPVMVASSGGRLMDPEAIGTLQRELLPLATLVTPNLPEAEALVGRPLRTEEEIRSAAQALKALGPQAVLIKGGHGEGEEVVDVLLDEEGFLEYRSPRLETPHTHGSGCVFAAAIAAEMAQGRSLREAVARAKEFVTEAIRIGTPVGRGFRPVNPLHPLGLPAREQP